MKDAYQILDEKFNDIYAMVDKHNYYGCGRLSHDLIVTFSLISYDDGMFICEILEGAFFNLDQILRTVKVNEDILDYLNKNLKNELSKILSCYKNEDKNGLYNTLKNIRVNVTNFQFTMWRMPQNIQPNIPLPNMPMNQMSIIRSLIGQ